MNIKSVFDKEFAQYGRVIEADFAALLQELVKTTEKPHDKVIYVPSAQQLEALPVFEYLRDNFYGGMPVQVGYCNGNNKTLNCLEYHRDTEINIAADDVVLLLAPLSQVAGGTIDTGEVEAFLLPAGSAVQLFETTLHYAPCTAEGGDGFRVIIVLPRGTNTEKPAIKAVTDEDKLLWARNKWLIAHPDSPEAKAGAYVGLLGKNITIK